MAPGVALVAVRPDFIEDLPEDWREQTDARELRGEGRVLAIVAGCAPGMCSYSGRAIGPLKENRYDNTPTF